MAAEKIRDYIGAEAIDIHNIADADLNSFDDYQYLLLGIPTWDYGELQEDWESIWDDLDDLDFKGKHFAIFGLGDQVGYPQWFQDAMGYLHEKLDEFDLSQDRIETWCDAVQESFGANV